MYKVNAASIPRSQRILGRANCLASDSVGNCVVITGSKIGDYYQVETMDPVLDGTDQAVAVITEKSSPTECVIQFHGLLSGVYSGLTAGKRLYVGIDGQLTHTPPSPAGGVLYLQLMGVAIDDEEVMLDPHVPWKRQG